MCAARLVGGGQPAIDVELPDGITAHGEAEASAALTALLGRPIELRRADPRRAATYEIAADFEAEHDSELLHWSGPAGTFHDSARTRLSIAALADMRDWAPRRFRANVLVSGATTADLVGEVVTIGGVTVEVTKHIDRCVLVTPPNRAASVATSTCCARSTQRWTDASASVRWCSRAAASPSATASRSRPRFP